MDFKRIEQVESVASDFVAKIAPWCAPVPTAFLAGKAVDELLT